MSYTAEHGETSATYRPLAEAPLVDGPNWSMRFIASDDLTQRQFGFFIREMRSRAGGPAPHFHRTFSESFYVLEGTIRFFDGDRWVEGSKGDFLYVPAGGIHAFNHDSDADASMVILFAPGTARENFFREAAEIRASGRELTPEEWTQFYARHDQYMV